GARPGRADALTRYPLSQKPASVPTVAPIASSTRIHHSSLLDRRGACGWRTGYVPGNAPWPSALPGANPAAAAAAAAAAYCDGACACCGDGGPYAGEPTGGV